MSVSPKAGRVGNNYEGGRISRPLLATSAHSKCALPKVGKKPSVLVEPQAPIGFKLVGAVKGTRIWADERRGEIRDANRIKG